MRQAIDDGGVYVNGKRCRKAGRLLRGGERLRLCLLDNERLQPFEAQQLLWQGNGLYLIHKRSGQYAQAALHRSKGTLPDELARYLKLPAGITMMPVHRLDRGTSGLMLLSDNPAIVQHMQARWHQDVRKAYLALVSPPPTWQQQRLQQPVSARRDAHGRYHVHGAGRACDTEASVLASNQQQALLSLIPHTGRSHQLRVHMAFIGCPLLGDRRYGGAQASRLMLHAASLRFPLPFTQRYQVWNIPPEDDWLWPDTSWQQLLPVMS